MRVFQYELDELKEQFIVEPTSVPYRGTLPAVTDRRFTVRVSTSGGRVRFDELWEQAAAEVVRLNSA
jgi:hypothetical protein